MVDYVETDLFTNPRCSHGPALLFSKKNDGRKFYACAAFRDKAICPFYMLQTDKKRSHFIDPCFNENISKMQVRREYIKNYLKKSIVKYCHTCEIVISNEESSKHKKHHVNHKIEGDLLQYPSKLLEAKQKSKAESQFHFSENSTKVICSFISQLKATAVICLGCPHLHESLIIKSDMKITSVLLDIDYRYLQFYEPAEFQMFNMYNAHMFDEENGWDCIENVGRKYDSVVLVVDPPFGGRIEPLVHTFKTIISKMSSKNPNCKVATFLILPYFMEPAVLQSFPHYSMMDYKVEYLNHRSIIKQSQSERGSPVRIFTNESLSQFKLPKKEGYKYCDMCERYVYKENKHCFKCEKCTSKNGGVYKHCYLCKKCVKETWKHCSTCKICKLPQHNCDASREMRNG